LNLENSIFQPSENGENMLNKKAIIDEMAHDLILFESWNAGMDM